MVGHTRAKADCLARQIETAKLCASQFAELADNAIDTHTIALARRYEAYWLDIAARRTAEMTGRTPPAKQVKA